MRLTWSLLMPFSPRAWASASMLARADPVHVGFLDHRQQGPLVPPARLEQRREVAALAQLANGQLDRPHPGVPFALPHAIARGQPLIGPLVRRGADRLGDFGIHQLLRQQRRAEPFHAVTPCKD